MIYDVTAHPLLSADAQRLETDELEQAIGVAEDLLGLARRLSSPVHRRSSLRTGRIAVATR